MLCFSRDTEIGQCIQSDFANISKSKQYEGPPSGVVPFHGICMFGNANVLHIIFLLNLSSIIMDLLIWFQRLRFVISSIRPSSCTSHFVHFTFVIVIVWQQSIHIRRVSLVYAYCLKNSYRRMSHSFGHISVNFKFNRMPILCRLFWLELITYTQFFVVDF